MIPSANSRTKKPSRFSLRRIALLSTALVAVGGGAFVLAPNLPPNAGYPAAFAQNLSEQAHKLQAPVGFADIVAKVKPAAVISVRVEVDGGVQTSGMGGMDNQNLPPGLREFFKQFGGQRSPRHRSSAPSRGTRRRGADWAHRGPGRGGRRSVHRCGGPLPRPIARGRARWSPA